MEPYLTHVPGVTCLGMGRTEPLNVRTCFMAYSVVPPCSSLAGQQASA